MFPTVREVLALDPVRRGEPRVVAGQGSVDRRVRWVHSAEVPDIATLLRGGELVLTTGIGLPGDGPGLRRFVADLAEVDCAGLVVELGRRYAGSVPPAMAQAAERCGLPLIELRRATPFVQITEAVHALIVDAQLAELRAAEQIHQRFTELSMAGAAPAEVVAQAAALSGCPVVLENLSRQVLAYDAAKDQPELLLDGWERHSRRITTTGRTGYDRDAGWLTTLVGARGQDWGRLLLRWPDRDAGASPGPPPTRLTILVERAASALALGRLIERDADGLERQIQHTVLAALVDHRRPIEEVAVRARAVGVPLEKRCLVGVAIRYRADPVGEQAALTRQRDLADAVAMALRQSRHSGLVGALDEHTVGVLLALAPGADPQPACRHLATLVRKPGRLPDSDLVVAAGVAVDQPGEARRSLVEARQVAQAARRDRRDIPVYALAHVGLAGLLHLLRDQPMLQTFVERELGPLLAYDADHPRDRLLDSLRGYLDHGRNKSAAAAAEHVSRPAFYDRLTRIGRLLDADLDSVDDCLSRHVALLALDAIRDGR